MAAKKPVKQGESRRSAGGRFLPGKSGNPKGRPPNEFSLTALLREAMEKSTVAGVAIPEGQTVAQAIVARMIDQAINGDDFRHLKEVWDRIDGKPRDADPEADAGEAIELLRKALNGKPG